MAFSLQRYAQYGSDITIDPFLKTRSKQERERSKIITIENGDCLPENVIVEILSWLPVKDLLKYKSVCKSWHSIISSQDFISKHLINYYHNNHDWRGCLLSQYYFSQGQLDLIEILVDDTPRILASQALHSIPLCGSFVCGPCDGLYYLYEYDYAGRALWNPAINELKVLPPIISKPDPPPNTTRTKHEAFGFGVDSVSRDYKVVVIKGYRSTTDEDIEYPLSVFVYSLKNDSWKYCGDLPRYYRLDDNMCYTFVNGCCHWLESSTGTFIGDDDTFAVIISFNLIAEAYEEINLPNYKQPSSKCLGIYDDSLAFVSVHQFEKNLDIWTLNNGLWIKKLTVGPFPDVRNPVGLWKDNKLFLECGNRLFLYDHDAQDIKDLAFQRDTMCRGIWAYMESLVSIKDFNRSGYGIKEAEADIGPIWKFPKVRLDN